MTRPRGEWGYIRLDRRLELLEVFEASLLAAWVCAASFALAWLAVRVATHLTPSVDVPRRIPVAFCQECS